MNKKLSAKIFFRLIIMIIQITSCKKEPFNSQQQSVLLPVPIPVNSQIRFWAKDKYGTGSIPPITINLNGETKILYWIIEYPGLTPPVTCQSLFDYHPVSFDVKAGTYYWTASIGYLSAAGSVTVSANNCVTQEVTY